MQVKKSDEDGTLRRRSLLRWMCKPATAETALLTPGDRQRRGRGDFHLDFRAIARQDGLLLVFESLCAPASKSPTMRDIEDGKQTTTVTRPQIGTTALDGHDGDKNVVTDGKTGDHRHHEDTRTSSPARPTP